MPSVKRLRKRRGMPEGSGKAAKSARVEIVGKERIEAMIDRKLRRVYERKEYVQYGVNQNLAIIIGTGNLTSNSFLVSPVLAQGTGVSARVGNVVTWNTCKINLIVNLKPYNALNNAYIAPYWVRVLIVGSKGSPKTNSITQTNVGTNFFSYGGGTTGFTNSPIDIMAEPNWEEWRLYDERKFKLGLSSGTNTTPSTAVNYFDNSSMSQRIEFDLTPMIKGRKLVYDDGYNYPTNGGMYCIIQMVTCDGSASIEQPGEYHLYHRSTYTDA